MKARKTDLHEILQLGSGDYLTSYLGLQNVCEWRRRDSITNNARGRPKNKRNYKVNCVPGWRQKEKSASLGC